MRAIIERTPAPTVSTTPSLPTRALIVRLRNWIGDVVLGVPTLRRLREAGYELHLVGKRWAGDLLAGEGFTVHALPVGRLDRVRLYRSLRAQARAADPGFDSGRPGANAVVFPYSFGSALEMRLAGLRAIGHAHEARAWLLHRHRPRRPEVHELETCWELADLLLGETRPLPEACTLRVSELHRAQARMRLAALGVAGPYAMLCPFSSGTYGGRSKHWPPFERFVREVAAGWGLPLLTCPGPGAEVQQSQALYPAVRTLEGVGLGEYAALLEGASLMLSNDTGPGHLAAAVGTPLVSLFGPTDAHRWRPWGPQVQLLQEPGEAWPSIERVRQACEEALAAPSPLRPAALHG